MQKYAENAKFYGMLLITQLFVYMYENQAVSEQKFTPACRLGPPYMHLATHIFYCLL